ncbi:MAG: LytTR family transcriptional regulator, partial [Bacteroidetes bacterium]|nr:LytTR family transcriptional regulator [Bacteroidota bacterium]
TVFYFLDQKKVVIPRTLKIFAELLSSMGFFRCHQSHLINLKQVIEYKRRKKGGIAILEDNTEIPVSESNKTRFMEQFSGLGL